MPTPVRAISPNGMPTPLPIFAPVETREVDTEVAVAELVELVSVIELVEENLRLEDRAAALPVAVAVPVY